MKENKKNESQIFKYRIADLIMIKVISQIQFFELAQPEGLIEPSGSIISEIN